MGFIDKTGEIRKSNNCGLMKIVGYTNARNIKVKFKTGCIVKTTYQNFKNGAINDPLFLSVHGIGFIGNGEYKTTINSKLTIEYTTWHHMIQRCYDPYFINKHLTYQDVTVCEEWLNFQNFAKWHQKNYYTLENIKLDKDIMKKGNKIYAPEFCSFVPKAINMILVKSDKIRGKYPVGVCFIKASNKYKAQIKVNGKQKHIGHFSTPEKAFWAYKIVKEKHIKVMANKYKEVLHTNVYNSLMNYEVEITD